MTPPLEAVKHKGGLYMGFWSNIFRIQPQPQKAAPPQIELPPIDFTVIDLETSGLDPSKHDILEIGALKYRNNTEVDRFHSYVLPKKPIPSRATQINGIDLFTVLGSPSFSQLQDKFLNFIGSDTIVGYNVRFDIQFVQWHCQRILENPRYDVLNFVRKVSPNEQNYKLENLRFRYNLSGTAHSALGDCEATVQLMQLFAEQIRKKS